MNAHSRILSFGEKIAHWADEFSTDAFGEMLAIICKCRSSKKLNEILNKFLKNSQLGLKQKSACPFWESGNRSIASNIFVDTRSIKKIAHWADEFSTDLWGKCLL